MNSTNSTLDTHVKTEAVILRVGVRLSVETTTTCCDSFNLRVLTYLSLITCIGFECYSIVSTQTLIMTIVWRLSGRIVIVKKPRLMLNIDTEMERMYIGKVSVVINVTIRGEY